MRETKEITVVLAGKNKKKCVNHDVSPIPKKERKKFCNLTS